MSSSPMPSSEFNSGTTIDEEDLSEISYSNDVIQLDMPNSTHNIARSSILSLKPNNIDPVDKH